MKPHGINLTSKCPTYSDFAIDFAALEHLLPPSSHTVLLIAADTRGISSDTISRVAKHFLDRGLICICVWGPDCERVHDIFDEVYIGDSSADPDFKLTSTWHSDESLDSAIEFLLECASPLDIEVNTTSYVAASVANAEWAATIDTALSELSAKRK